MPFTPFAHCAKCDYELTGLPQRGKCPECGHKYSLVTGMGTMEAIDPVDRMISRARRALTLGLAGLGVLLLLVGMGLALTGHPQWLWVGGFLFVLLMCGAWYSYLSERS